MTLPGGADPGPDQLSSGGDRSRVQWTLTTLVIGVVAILGIVLARNASNDSNDSDGSRRPPAPTASPSTSPAPQPSGRPAGTVFLEHLPGCTRTDHRHALTVAFGVDNLGPAS